MSREIFTKFYDVFLISIQPITKRAVFHSIFKTFSKIILSIAFLLIIIPPSVGKEEGQYVYKATPLIKREYYDTLLKELRGARKSIKVAMYAASRGSSSSDPVNRILQQLIEAKKRGVDVQVILEYQGVRRGKLYNSHLEILNYLNNNGITTYFDDEYRELHDKFVLIDGSTVLLGNHNWSRAALYTNDEVSFLIKSNPPNPEFNAYFEKIKSKSETVESQEKRRDRLFKMMQEMRRGEHRK